MNQNKRTEKRHPFQKECILRSNGFGMIKCKTVDASSMGVGVLINGTLPIQNGDLMSVDIEYIFYHSEAIIQWIKHDYNINATRVGLKVSNCLIN